MQRRCWCWIKLQKNFFFLIIEIIYLLQTVSIRTLGVVKFKTTCPVEVSHVDHVVLTVKSVPETVNFYTSVLGMEVITFKVCSKKMPYTFHVQLIIIIVLSCLLFKMLAIWTRGSEIILVWVNSHQGAGFDCISAANSFLSSQSTYEGKRL